MGHLVQTWGSWSPCRVEMLALTSFVWRRGVLPDLMVGGVVGEGFRGGRIGCCDGRLLLRCFVDDVVHDADGAAAVLVELQWEE